MEWKAVVEAVLAQRRERLGDPVSLDEIFILHDATQGEVELSQQERDRLLDRISADPDAANKLLGLLRFPALAADDEGAETVGVEERWRAFCDRHLAAVETAEESEDDSAEDPPRVATPGDAIPFQAPMPASTSRPRFMPLAASFGLGAFMMLAAGLLWGPASSINPPEADEARINLAIVELLDDGSGITRSSEPVRLSASSDGMVVTLTVSRLEGPGPFDLTVLDRSGETVLRDTGLEPGPGGVFVLSLPRVVLEDGSLQLQLQRDGESVASFAMEVALIP